MKNYVILADSVTGLKGKIMRKNEVHPEMHFDAAHIADLINGKAIKEQPEDKPAKTSKEEKPAEGKN